MALRASPQRWAAKRDPPDIAIVRMAARPSRFLQRENPLHPHPGTDNAQYIVGAEGDSASSTESAASAHAALDSSTGRWGVM
jgi:hypothetical protein